MANRKKTYFLCPTWDHAPDGPIQLGSIVMSADMVAEPLNFLDRIPPPSAALLPPSYKTGVEYATDKQRSQKYGIWTSFLSVLGVGVDLGFEHGRNDDLGLKFDRIETSEFLPPQDYLEMSMLAPAVVTYIERQRFTKSVYMVTAIKTVYGVSGNTTSKRKLASDAKLSVDGTAIGVAPVSLGPEVAVHNDKGEALSFTGSSDFVFAFRLRRIIVKKKGEIIQRLETKGAMFDGQASAVEKEVPFDVLGVPEDDSCMDDHGDYDAIEAFDADIDDACLCVPLHQNQ